MFDDGSNKRKCIIGDYGDIVGGATPSTANPSYFCLNGIPWITPKDLTSSNRKFIFNGENDISKEAYDSCSTKILPKGTVLLTSRAPVGTVAITMNELCTNQGFKSVIPNSDLGTGFVYYFLKENKALLESHASGTTFTEISGNTLKSIPAFFPTKNKLNEFSEYCKTFFPLQLQIEVEICKLSMLRQTLISGMSSGEIIILSLLQGDSIGYSLVGGNYFQLFTQGRNKDF